ncbi:hypothetical protein M918_18095 [Clostridium sp. BL8]|nr:hypothetical protein M918_18095 [Clostridium sp. BL8]
MIHGNDEESKYIGLLQRALVAEKEQRSIY